MSNIVVDIEQTENPQYAPNDIAEHGDTVTFRLAAGVVSATVTFDKDTGSCLDVPGPFNLYSTPPEASQCTHPVSPSSKGFYPFSVNIPALTPESRIRGDHEVKRGGIDVATDTQD